MIRAGWFLVAALAVAAPAQAADKNLAAIPFWKMSAGWWQSENTYFNSALDYNIRSYNSLLHVEVKGRRVIETEYKFYAPSKLALQNGRGQTKEDEGVEVVTVTTYEQTDAKGTVRVVESAPAMPASESNTQVLVLNADTAERVTTEKDSKVDLYRMLITQPTADKRYKANYGIVSVAGKGGDTAGDLRGFSLFRETRIPAKDVEALRASLRAKNKVHAVVSAGPDNKPAVKRID